MQRNNLFWGGILLLFGGLLLLGNLGILEIDVWGLFWPLFLILLGAAILWGTVASHEQVSAEEVSLPLDGASRAEVQFNHGAGKLKVRGGNGPNELLSGRFEGGLDHRIRRSGDQIFASLRVKSRGVPWLFTPWNIFSRGALDWDVMINDQIPMELHFKTGANDALIDLTGMKITDLKLETGVSSTEVILPDSAGFTQTKINAGVASLQIRVPEGVAAHISTSGGLVNISVDQERFPRIKGGYQSAEYHSASNRVDIKVDAGVGSVSII